MTDSEHRVSVAADAARAGAAVAHEASGTDVAVETKAHATDVVTDADREAQAAVVGTIRESYPEEVVVGEEDDATATAVPATGPAWVVDPIDGTSNFVRGVPLWGTAVAAVRDGDPVAAATVLPAAGKTVVAGSEGTRLNGAPASVSDTSDPTAFYVAVTMWWDRDRRGEFAAVCEGVGERFGDLRRFGSGQATLALVATGALDAAVTNVTANPWDTVGGVHLVRQAGGTVTDVHGDPWTHDAAGLVASNGAAHDEVLAALDAVR